jgi:hypothetical protein
VVDLCLFVPVQTQVTCFGGTDCDAGAQVCGFCCWG